MKISSLCCCYHNFIKNMSEPSSTPTAAELTTPVPLVRTQSVYPVDKEAQAVFQSIISETEDIIEEVVKDAGVVAADLASTAESASEIAGAVGAVAADVALVAKDVK